MPFFNSRGNGGILATGRNGGGGGASSNVQPHAINTSTEGYFAKTISIQNMSILGGDPIKGIDISLDVAPLIAGDRIFLKDQTDPTENGLWVYLGPGQPLVRAAEFDSEFEVQPGAMIVIGEDNTTNASTLWKVRGSTPVRVGVDDMNFDLMVGTTSGGPVLCYLQQCDGPLGDLNVPLGQTVHLFGDVFYGTVTGGGAVNTISGPNDAVVTFDDGTVMGPNGVVPRLIYIRSDGRMNIPSFTTGGPVTQDNKDFWIEANGAGSYLLSYKESGVVHQVELTAV